MLAIMFQSHRISTVNVASTAKTRPATEYNAAITHCSIRPPPMISRGAKLPAIGRSTQSCRL